jgi:glycosyltransferase involved in cell wall biosynthesis
MAEALKILVFDQPRKGHHKRLVQVLCASLGASPLVRPIARAWWRLIAWRGAVICNSCSEYVAPFLAICAARFVLGRRTVAILVRDPRTRWKDTAWRRRLFNWVTGLPTVRLLTLTEPAAGSAGDDWIHDSEWWDLSVCPLPTRAVTFPGGAGRPTILFLGDIHARKGIAFFIATALAASRRGLPCKFVLAGDTSGLDRQSNTDLAEAGIFVLPRVEDDATFVSLIRACDWLWCCYRPDWDGSSGLYGRALQLGIKAIIRRGSYLERFQRQYGNGVAVQYGDANALLDTLAARCDIRQAPAAAFASRAIARLQVACGIAP